MVCGVWESSSLFDYGCRSRMWLTIYWQVCLPTPLAQTLIYEMLCDNLLYVSFCSMDIAGHCLLQSKGHNMGDIKTQSLLKKRNLQNKNGDHKHICEVVECIRNKSSPSASSFSLSEHQFKSCHFNHIFWKQ